MDTQSYKAEDALISSVEVPLKKATITIFGRNIRYIEAGIDNVQPLLLLHGGNIGWGQWHPNIAALSKKFHVYALDLPGAGRSDRIDYRKLDVEKDFVSTVDEFITKLNLDQPHLVGSSIGGWITLKLAANQNVSQKIGKIVLSDAVGFMNFTRLADKIIGFYPLALFLTKTFLKPQRENKAIEAFLRGVFYKKNLDLDPNFIDYFYETMSTSHNLLLISKLSSVSGMRKEFILIEELNKIKNEAMVIWGKHDALMPLEKNTQNFHKLSNLKKVVILDDAGHIPSIEQSEEFNKAVESFLIGSVV